MLDYSQFIAFTKEQKKLKMRIPKQVSVSNIFVFTRCQGNMCSCEVLSQSDIYLSEPMWPHTLAHLAPEINLVYESLVLSPQGSLWDWAIDLHK